MANIRHCVKTVILAVLLGNGVSTICTAQMHNDQLQVQLDELFKTRYSNEGPGAATLISRNGKVIYSKQFGMADIEHEIPVSENTRFPIGSITKQFTAAGILILAEEGGLTLTDSISLYLSSLPTKWKSITVEQLLTHSSGIPDYPRIASIRQRLRDDLDQEEILDLVMSEPLDFTPGERVAYSNSGFLLLGKIIEAVSGKSYSAFLSDRIFEPLRMAQTTVGDHSTIVKGRARGYSTDNDEAVIHATYHSSSYGAGAIISTTHDLNHWITNLWSGEVLNEQSKEKMFGNYTLENGLVTGMGLGWEFNEIGGLSTYEHSGFEPGYKANSAYIPREGLYVVVLQNSEEGSPTPSMINAAALALGRPYPDASKAIDPVEIAAEAFVGTYLFSNEDTRIIGLTDSGYYYRAPGGKATSLYALNEQTLVFPEGYRQLKLTYNSSGDVTGIQYKNRVNTIDGIKVDSNVSEENVEIVLSTEILEGYVGVYQLEAFEMTISLEHGKLFAQPSGSNKLPLIPKDKTSFFIDEIGAEIEFSLEEGYATINILIEGKRMRGTRK